MRQEACLRSRTSCRTDFSRWSGMGYRERIGMKIGTKEFDIKNRTYVMGILNATPDSFSDGGRWDTCDAALRHAGQMVREGADIIDVGGESTRPGYVQISDGEEIERVVPVVEKIRENFDIPISIDTYKSKVAKAALAAGADLVNDIWGLKYDAALAGVIADTGAACCLMHNRSQAGEHPYQDFMQDMVSDLRESIRIAKKAGIVEDKIILDPGIGFAKTYENNLQAIRCLEQLHVLGYPVLLGTSRKSVIGLSLGLPVEERLEGTLVTTVFAVMKQCAFVRVHDVKENVRAVRMAEAVLYS